MDSLELYSHFTTLTASDADSNAFNVIAITGTLHKLGISSEGYPKFFIKTSTEKPIVPNTVLELLSVEYNLQCTVVEEDGIRQDELFSIITLQSSEEKLQKYFVEIVLLMIGNLQQMPTCRELSLEVENLISIFMALSSASRKTVQGLWAELLVIERSSYPETLINAWHSSPDSKFDFTLGRDKIEVKSTAKDTRVHHFSLDQLNPSPNSKLLIASTIVRESGEAQQGLCIRDLYMRICSRVIAVNARLKLNSVMAKTIGKDYAKLDSEFFDYVTASDTLAFYNSQTIPHIDKATVPEFVSGVEFDSDLSHLEDVLHDGSNFDIQSSPLYKSIFNL